MAVFNSLTIGGINSLDYGIYITGEGVYDAPNRAVEMVEIHGRNGALILDKGHYENIEIKYPCGSFGESGKTFEQRITDFKNAVLSLRGYQRLTDTYATDVYRLASCANGFEVAPVQGGKAGEFDLVFNCKPQRFLTSGETLVTVANNGTLTNPTAFDSQPTIQVNGYGTLTFNGYTINIKDREYGLIELVKRGAVSNDEADFSLKARLFDEGNTLTIEQTTYRFVYRNTNVSSKYILASYDVTASSGDATLTVKDIGNGTAQIDLTLAEATTAAKQTSIADTVSRTIKFTFTPKSGVGYTEVTATFEVYRNYAYAVNRVRYWVSASLTQYATYQILYGAVTVDSTVSVLGTPTIIDCELGEVYKIEGNEIESLNAYVDIGSDLPTLASGTNTFTKSNTITSLKVKPNWWKL